MSKETVLVGVGIMVSLLLGIISGILASNILGLGPLDLAVRLCLSIAIGSLIFIIGLVVIIFGIINWIYQSRKKAKEEAARRNKEEKQKVRQVHRPLYNYLRITYLNELMQFWRYPGKYQQGPQLPLMIEKAEADLADFLNTKDDYAFLRDLQEMDSKCNYHVSQALNQDAEGDARLPAGIEIRLEKEFIRPIRGKIWEIIKESETK